MEKLVQMGVILKPRDSAVNARQGKAKASPTGHVLFFDGREECELACYRVGLMEQL